jgi:hypothetical protein
MISRKIVACICVLFMGISTVTYAADSEVTLDTSDANSGFTVKDSVGAPVMSARGDGKVGIGTTSPSSALEVNGDILSDTVGYDAEGAFRFCKVNNVKTKIYTRYFMGTLDSDSETLVAHGISDYNKILDVRFIVYSSSVNGCQDYYYFQEGYWSNVPVQTFSGTFDSTNIFITNMGSCYYGQNYRAKIEYTE